MAEVYPWAELHQPLGSAFTFPGCSGEYVELKGTDDCDHEAGVFKCLLCYPKKDADKDWHALNKPGDVANMRRHAGQMEHTHMRRVVLTVLLDHLKRSALRLDSLAEVLQADFDSAENQVAAAQEAFTEVMDQLNLEKDLLHGEVQVW